MDIGAVKDGMKSTALHEAAKWNHCNLIRLFVSHVGVNARNSGGFTALHEAARWNNVSSGEVLIELGANPRVRSTVTRESAHDVAQYHGSLEFASMLEYA